MTLPTPPETPDPNIDDPNLPPPEPERDPDELPFSRRSRQPWVIHPARNPR